MDLNQIILIEERSELNQLLLEHSKDHPTKSTPSLIQSIAHKHPAKTYLRLIQTRRFFLISSIILGVILSITTTKYTGKTPINVFYYLIIFVIIPLISFLVTRSKSLTKFIFQKDKHTQSTLTNYTQQYHSNSLCLAGCLLTLTGSLCLVVIGIFTDLHFSWSTTYAALNNSQIFQFFSALEFPWVWLSNFHWLNNQLVEASQYNHLNHKFFGTIDQSYQGKWVGFLTSTTIVYSVLPRLIYLSFGFFSFQKKIKQYELSTSKKVYFQNTINPQNNHEDDKQYSIISLQDLTLPYFLYYTDENPQPWLNSHNIKTVSELKECSIVVVVVDAYESPDKSFRAYLKQNHISPDVDLAILPLQKTAQNFVGPTKNQREVWSTMSVHREIMLVEVSS